MSTTFAIDDGSAVQSESPTAEDDSIVYSRYSAMALLSRRPPSPRRSRRTTLQRDTRRVEAVAMPPDDTQTANRCRDALRWITTLPEDSVQVRVNSGRVTLEGTVRREHEREAAAEALRQVEGVVGVDNRLDVQ